MAGAPAGTVRGTQRRLPGGGCPFIQEPGAGGAGGVSGTSGPVVGVADDDERSVASLLVESRTLVGSLATLVLLVSAWRRGMLRGARSRALAAVLSALALAAQFGGFGSARAKRVTSQPQV